MESFQLNVSLRLSMLGKDFGRRYFEIFFLFVFFFIIIYFFSSENMFDISCKLLETICISLRKHAYSSILKVLHPKNENFKRKKSDILHISAQNIDCGYSLEPPRSTHNLGF